MMVRLSAFLRLSCSSGIVAAVFASCAWANPAAAQAVAIDACTQADSSSTALRECTTLLKAFDLSDQDRIALHMKRGQAWLSEEEPGEAASDFTRVLAIDPDHEQALILRARANTALGKHQLAVADWTAVIAKSAETFKEGDYLERASSWLAAGDTGAALKDYDEVLKANPKSIKACLGRAKVFEALNDREKALAEFARAQAIDPQDITPYIARAEAAERWGDTKMAIENYSFVVQNNTRSAGPYRKALQRLGVDTPP